MHDVYDEKNNLIVGSNEIIYEKTAKQIESSGIESIEIRSPLTCQTKRGICRKCYGVSLSTGRLVQLEKLLV